MTTQNAINWPEEYLPGTGDNLVSNEAVTFGFPPLAARVVEFAAPAAGTPGRLSWTARQDGGPDERLDGLLRAAAR
jgi:hypothetical protein